MVVLVTAIALFAVACGGGGDDSGQAANTTLAPDGSTAATTTAPATTAAPKKIDTIPGMPGVPDPNNLYSETTTGKFSPQPPRARSTRVYVPNRAVEHRVGDRSGHDAGGRHVQGRPQPAARRPVVGPQDAVGHEQRRGSHRRHPHADRPEDRQARARRSPSTTRTTCTSRPTASRRSSSPRRASDSTSSTRRRCSSRARSTSPDCAGVNHADFSIDGKFAIFTCEFQGSLVKVDIVNHTVVGLPAR